LLLRKCLIVSRVVRLALIRVEGRLDLRTFLTRLLRLLRPSDRNEFTSRILSWTLLLRPPI
jgi:hypothetical protein